ncbi:hypothetical protein LCGC14_1071150 [marine sediment metagenome]|uniref:Uncharacterized protein n=1 Tax=marine sediment metagenome TaxID=412755 RepID=A0A0F9Q195_9ZZZZ
MNWYKRAQRLIENLPKDMSYLDIGHNVYRGDKPRKEPNQLWIYYEGQILIEPETEELTRHFYAFDENMLDGSIYSGRYDSYTGALSISPNTEMSRMRSIPDFLIRSLKQKFPNIKDMYVFD